MQLLSDGDEVFVEYGSGPKAFTSRWEGRPPTPDFVWDGDGVVLPPHNIWLDNMDLTHEGLHELVDKEIKDTDPEALAKDLAAVKALLKQHAGSLQACFLFFEFQVCKHSFKLSAHKCSLSEGRHCAMNSSKFLLTCVKLVVLTQYLWHFAAQWLAGHVGTCVAYSAHVLVTVRPSLPIHILSSCVAALSAGTAGCSCERYCPTESLLFHCRLLYITCLAALR